FRIDDHRRAVTADAQAAGAGALADVVPGRKARVLDLLLEQFPRLLADLRRAAFWAQAQENVAFDGADADLLFRRVELLLIGHDFSVSCEGSFGPARSDPITAMARRAAITP